MGFAVLHIEGRNDARESVWKSIVKVVEQRTLTRTGDDPTLYAAALEVRQYLANTGYQFRQFAAC